MTRSCPHCDEPLTLRPEHRGKTLRCKHCRNTFAVPKAKARRSNLPVMIVGLVLVALVVAGLVGSAMSMRNTAKELDYYTSPEHEAVMKENVAKKRVALRQEMDRRFGKDED